jgi:hypothetical protein
MWRIGGREYHLGDEHAASSPNPRNHQSLAMVSTDERAPPGASDLSASPSGVSEN